MNTNKTTSLSETRYLSILVFGLSAILFILFSWSIADNVAHPIQNIMSNQGPLRNKIVSFLITQCCFSLLFFMVYQLFKSTKTFHAFLLVIKVMISLAIMCLKTLCQPALRLIEKAEKPD